MKRDYVAKLTVAKLVERFAAICVEQSRALFAGDIGKFNRLFDRMVAIRDELKNRPGDERTALLTLFDHPDTQVRLQAARMTLAVAPKESRRTIETIANSGRQPQAGDAGMCLTMLDRGIFSPK
jgi:hypothetical protein